MTRIKILIKEKYKIVVCLFFAVFLWIGISVFKDYGISWDESSRRHAGIINTLYVFKGNQRLLTESEDYHGPAFEMRLFQWELTKLI